MRRVSDHLRRLFAPRSVALVGGAAAEAAVLSCRSIGYSGDIWPVSTTRPTVGGIPCFADLAGLPGVPDAAFVSVSRERTISVVAELGRLGTAGVVCHASGFAEAGDHGRRLEADLVAAAGDMALVGPNCLGFLNYLDGAALWPEQHGGSRVDRGVAVISQSGNIGLNLTMQRRSLPLAKLVTVGNCAVTGVPELVEAMLEDPRITAIGLHLEDLPDIPELSRVALSALRRRVPLVVLKTGSSELGAAVNLSHTSSLAGSDVLCDALFRRLGIARVYRVETFLETLKLLHVHGAMPAVSLASASCSGGEAAHVADLAQSCGIAIPEFSETTSDRLRSVLGDRVAVRNPLDYHTFVWDDGEALRECFDAFLDSGADCHLLVLDFPRADRCDARAFVTTVDAFLAAHEAAKTRACVVSSLPEGLPEEVGERLAGAGIAPMQGIADCMAAIVAAGEVGAAQRRVGSIQPLARLSGCFDGTFAQLDEAAAKEELKAWGIPVPAGLVGTRGTVAQLAARLGFPVALKSLSSTVAHKSDVQGVRLGLMTGHAVELAAADMSRLGERFLVETMVGGVTAELVVGIQRDPRFGLALTIGAGGVLVEVLDDSVTLLLPATTDEIRSTLGSLRIWPLVAGFRGRSTNVAAVVDAVATLADYAVAHAARLSELEVNPLLVLTDGVMAVDALIRLAEPAPLEAASAPMSDAARVP